MSLSSRILVAVDGSGPSTNAVQLALRLAAPRHDLLSFVSVFDRDAATARCTTEGTSGATVAAILAAAEAECEAVLAAATASAALAGLDAGAVRRTGPAAETILDEARQWGASCVVIGTHARQGIARALLGSCAEGVLRKSHVPVLFAHAQPIAGGGQPERILCAVDDSPAARQAFDAAAALARDWNAELHLLSVVQIADAHAAQYEASGVDPDGSVATIYGLRQAALVAISADAIAQGTQVHPHVLGAWDVAARIVGSAATYRCDLIVLGTHGRGGLPRLLLGSTAESVVRSSTIPVLAFRDPRGPVASEARPQDAVTYP